MKTFAAAIALASAPALALSAAPALAQAEVVVAGEAAPEWVETSNAYTT